MCVCVLPHGVCRVTHEHSKCDVDCRVIRCRGKMTMRRRGWIHSGMRVHLLCDSPFHGCSNEGGGGACYVCILVYVLRCSSDVIGLRGVGL